MMDIENRIYPNGPNRKEIKNILNNDRKIVSHIIFSASVKVLQDDFHFDAAKINDFRAKVQSEINRM